MSCVERRVLSIFQLLVQRFSKANLEIPESIRKKASEALLAASQSSCQVRQEVLPIVAEFVDNRSPLHLQAELAHQQSISSRLSAGFDRSERFIHDFCCQCGSYKETCIPQFYQQLRPEQVDQKLNAAYGRLHRSHLENLVQCDKYKSAIEEVDNWQVPKYPSTLETNVRPSLTVTVCKIFRSQGLFLDIRERLELCLGVLEHEDPNKILVLCCLADACCDLAEARRDFDMSKAQDSLKAVQLLIDPEMKKKSTKSKAFRRLMTSTIQVDIQRNRHEDARTNIEEMKGIFSSLSNLDVSDQLLHVRVLVASARTYQDDSRFVEAVEEWKTVLAHVQRYSSFEGEGFTYAAVHLSLSLVYLKIGDSSKARVSFDHAEGLLSRGVLDYWIPTLWAWTEDTLSKIHSLRGWESGWKRLPHIRSAI